jgi:hypothetical protein
MSKWITWQEILKNWRISPFDFYSKYIQQGLRPYTQTHHPLDPRDVMGSVYSKTECFIDNTPEPFVVEGVENRTFYHSKRSCAELWNKKKLNLLDETTWADFELPSDQQEADFFFKAMENTIYKKEHADNLKKNKPIDEDDIKSIQKDKPSTRHRKASQKVAKKIWAAPPPGGVHLTIREMSEHPEIREACEGKKYSFKVYQRWFTDLNPNQNPGKRKKRT